MNDLKEVQRRGYFIKISLIRGGATKMLPAVQ